MESINIEYKNRFGEYPCFFERVKNKALCIAYDINTKPFAKAILVKLKELCVALMEMEYPDEELIPDEDACNKLKQAAKNSEYILAVGSGTLNDMAKYISSDLGIDCGVLATAPSMDGYCSKGSALMIAGEKITYEVHMPSDVLIDLDIIKSAPKMMIAAGFGDIVGKYTCLTDWKLASIVNGEPIHEEAFVMMEKARAEVMESFDDLTGYAEDAVAKLMNALIVAGTSMAICGNSRPASGSEHHQSHFLEMDFVRRGERIPMHGVKVAIGTLVSITLYNYLKDNQVQFKGSEEVYRLVDELPSVESVENMLIQMNCPTKFSQIGVRRETMEEMIEKAYTVRDRYTILTLMHDLGLSKMVKPMVLERFF